MASATLLASAGFALAAAAVYAYVGRRLSRRRVQAEAQLAARLFTVWWYGLAGTTALGALGTFAAWAGHTELPLFIALNQLMLLLVCVALWGLLYYLTYLFTGRSAALAPLSVLYAAEYVGLVYFVASLQPVGVDVSPWTASLRYATQPAGPLMGFVVLLLIGPQVGGALAYFSLLFKVRDRTQRWRVGLVSSSILVWFGSTIAASALGASNQEAWQWASRAIGLGAALTILLAYVPPRAVRERWGIEAVEIEGPSRAPQARPVP